MWYSSYAKFVNFNVFCPESPISGFKIVFISKTNNNKLNELELGSILTLYYR